MASQDKLLFGALVGTLPPSLIPFITQSQTSHDAWKVLANTYAKPSHGHIKQIKEQLKQTTKGSQTISEYIRPLSLVLINLLSLVSHLTMKILLRKLWTALMMIINPL